MTGLAPVTLGPTVGFTAGAGRATGAGVATEATGFTAGVMAFSTLAVDFNTLEALDAPGAFKSEGLSALEGLDTPTTGFAALVAGTTGFETGCWETSFFATAGCFEIDAVGLATTEAGFKAFTGFFAETAVFPAGAFVPRRRKATFAVPALCIAPLEAAGLATVFAATGRLAAGF